MSTNLNGACCPLLVQRRQIIIMWPKKFEWLWNGGHRGCGGFDKILDRIQGGSIERGVQFLSKTMNISVITLCSRRMLLIHTFNRSTSISSSFFSCWSSSLSSSADNTMSAARIKRRRGLLYDVVATYLPEVPHSSSFPLL